MPNGFHEDDDDPSRYSVWPTHRRGTLYPDQDKKPIPPWLDTIGLIVMLAILVVAGCRVWWFIEAVRNR